MNKQHKQSGFTLIEMMVVVVVIALLGAMIGPTLFKKVQQAEETRVSQDIRTVVGALKFYRLDNYRYPTQAQGLEALVTAPAGAESKWNGPYLETLPKDPWGEPYQYQTGTHGKEIEVYSPGADGQTGGEGSNQDLGNWNIQ